MSKPSMLEAPFLQEMIHTASNMYRLGWNERNGGNISMLLSEEEISPYLDLSRIIHTLPMGFQETSLAGKYFLVTGTGKYFKNMERNPEENLGLIRVSKSGDVAELLWGYSSGGTFTSELPAHLMTHVARLTVNPQHKVVTHCHPTNLLAMTFVHSLDEREFTRSLWQMCTECLMVFPDGVGVLPWMLCGTNMIGMATADKMYDRRLVVWAHHGLYGAGDSLDEAFGLIETAEKAAEVYMKIAHLPRLSTITDEQMHLIEKRFCVTARDGYLD